MTENPIPDYVPAEWPPLAPAATSLCACPEPLPQVRAERKGAARTYCARCDLPLPLALRR